MTAFRSICASLKRRVAAEFDAGSRDKNGQLQKRQRRIKDGPLFRRPQAAESTRTSAGYAPSNSIGAGILGKTKRVSRKGSPTTTAGLPLIAIVGRPNVGKSTLFNRLTGSRRSIVGDEPGITRDRIYGEVDWQGRTARLVDTGGIIPDEDDLIPAAIFEQAQMALAEADVLIMVVDGRTELASPDLDLARILLRSGKPAFLAVNKIDTEKMQAAAENFRRLGFKNIQAVSSEHGIGIGDLLEQVFEALPPAVEPEEEARHSKLKQTKTRRTLRASHCIARTESLSSTRQRSRLSGAPMWARARC